MRQNSSKVAASPTDLMTQSDDLLAQANLLKQQSPTSLFRLRLFDIGVPLLLSIFSIYLTLRYPLTEARCYEIKAALKVRHAERAAEPPA